MAYGPKDVTAKHWLVIGPWDHGGTRRPKEQVGGLSFGPSVVMSMEELHKVWYDHVLKGGPVPELLKDRVVWFVAGRNTWYSASELKQIEGAPMKVELDVTGAMAGDVTRSGRLLAQAPTAPATLALTSDPKYLPSREEVELDNPDWVRDQHSEYQTGPGKVVLHSAPFTAEMVLAGRPRLSLQVACDQPDADLFVQLYEVLPDGSAVYLAESSMRLRYRKGGTETVPMMPGKPERLSLPPMRFFARSIAKGSRLRLIIDAGPRLGTERNTHTGGDLASEPIAKGRIANITIMTGPDSGSVLEIPRPDDALLQRKDEPKHP
jgi:putative CocE/NonD family hydrolase